MDVVEQRRKSISEAFHTFHQPLTSLHCGIEIALAKPRTEAEYQKRLQDALRNAGAVLQLNRALRELVDAVDPGERFGTIALGPLISQVANEVSTVTEGSGVAIVAGQVKQLFVAADPMKLLRALAAVLMEMANNVERGGMVKIKASQDNLDVAIVISQQGARRELPSEALIEERAQGIRLDAARWYLQTIGGSVRVEETNTAITLPLAN
jgi:signal transduction histidine kinase